MNYQNIDPRNIENGDGIRCVLWVSGCAHNCKGCFNPQTHDPKSGIEFDDNAKNEIRDALNKDYCAGLTLSGGDPLFPTNVKDVIELCKMVKDEYNKTVWMWTGMRLEKFLSLYENILTKYVDVLIDGEFKEELASKTYHWGGSTNQRVVDIPGTLKKINNALDSGELKLQEYDDMLQNDNLDSKLIAYHEPDQKESY